MDFDFHFVFDGKYFKIVGVVFYHIRVGDCPLTDEDRVVLFGDQLVHCRRHLWLLYLDIGVPEYSYEEIIYQLFN